ncbi:MAG: PilZ domain-containing protein [Candidatus Omnitrophica bacterium]|nr:PilZ domain-containing protein [Candidatus Omnitrophota bacterium]
MLEITFKKIKGAAVLHLSGSIDINSANLVEKVGWALSNGYRQLICDFENVELVDYAGMSCLALAFKHVLNHQGKLKFVAVPAHIQKLFSLVCLDRVFEICKDLESALDSFEAEEVITQIKRKQLRRRFKRLPLDIDVYYKAKYEEDYHQGKALNLSGIGVMIFSQKTYPVGEVLDLKLTLKPQPGQLFLEARVVWLVEKHLQPQIYPGMGLEFYRIDPHIQEKIIQFVERNLPLSNLPDY